MQELEKILEEIKEAQNEYESQKAWCFAGGVERAANIIRKNMKNEEDILKFYYCESEDDYYIGKRVQNMYYARYADGGFTWFMSRYLPWGERVTAPETAWKEYTYPTEPKEIPFTEWIEGFIRKHMNDGCIPVEERLPESTDYILLSFSNFSLPTVGRYEEDSEGGAFYLGDDEGTCVSQGLYVNAWHPLPEPYQPETETQRPEWRGVEGQDATYVSGRPQMIDDHRIRQMAREYEMNPSVVRRLLEKARDVPALRIGRRYQEMTGGDAGGQENTENGQAVE